MDGLMDRWMDRHNIWGGGGYRETDGCIDIICVGTGHREQIDGLIYRETNIHIEQGQTIKNMVH